MGLCGGGSGCACPPRRREQGGVELPPLHLGPGSYGLQDVQDALLRAYGDLGAWPTEWEYHEWAAIKRLISRSDPRLPGPKQIRKCFGDFATALEMMRDAYERTNPSGPQG